MDGIRTETHVYRHDDTELVGYVATPSRTTPRPGVLVFPTWKGLDDFARREAEALAALGYVGFAVDVYGAGRVASDDDEAASLMNEFAGDRPFLRGRGRAALDALAGLEEVDTASLAGVGFCFGGMAVLELARAGVPLRAAVSYHGFLDTPIPAAPGKVRAKLLAHHGNDDPLLGAHEADAFRSEMTEAGVDWTLIVYGNTMHGFTNPAAAAPEKGIQYQPDAARRARETTAAFLRGVFGE